MTSVDNMTVAQAQSFFDQVSPEPYGAYANALYNQGELFTRQVALQMHGTQNPGGGLSFWGRGYGVWGNGATAASASVPTRMSMAARLDLTIARAA